MTDRTFEDHLAVAKAIVAGLTDPPPVANIRDLPENERDAARAALLKSCDTAWSTPRKPPVWNGKLARDCTPNERAAMYAALNLRVA